MNYVSRRKPAIATLYNHIYFILLIFYLEALEHHKKLTRSIVDSSNKNVYLSKDYREPYGSI